MFELQYECSNNKAEYEALILGLKILLSQKAKNVGIIGVSLLVVKQVEREYRCISPNMIQYLAIVARLLYEFDEVVIRLDMFLEIRVRRLMNLLKLLPNIG